MTATPFQWDMPVQYVKGVGPKRAEKFFRLGVATLEEAFFFLPREYKDRSNIQKISSLSLDSEQTVCGEIKAVGEKVTQRKKMKILLVAVSDDTGVIYAKWFNQPYLTGLFKKKKDRKVMLSGKVQISRFHGPVMEMENPKFEFLDKSDEELIHTGRIVPIYHGTEGLDLGHLRRIMKEIIDRYAGQAAEILPEEIRSRHRLLPLSEAIREAHFPGVGADISALNRGTSPAHRRLVFDELFLLSLGLVARKRHVSQEEKGIMCKTDGTLPRELLSRLPFQLTPAQTRVIGEIARDMASPHPMNRLLQGDVGCGKTVVALYAILIAVENGQQAALMVPTEVLAEQHYLNIKDLLHQLGVTSLLLTSRLSRPEREKAIQEIAQGRVGVVVGTHALIQEGVQFSRLSLAVIDEQHKFGVMQRAVLKKKGYNPDVLIMTATPIPRTLALSLYGDLDVSVIDELPPGRPPVATRLLREEERGEAYRLIAEEVEAGRQAYVVYPLVEESPADLPLAAAVAMAGHLQHEVFPHRRVGLLHGKLKSEEKETVMREFKEGSVQILVASTVIEVGIDVPNATVMLIEHAERFGLAQLHQLRGRVGRGGDDSFCLLMAGSPLTEEASQRLSAMVKTRDGFLIAEEDLDIRGPGEFFGTRQSGLPDLRVASLIRDVKILEEARAEAIDLLHNDPSLADQAHRELKASLVRRWENRIELIAVS